MNQILNTRLIKNKQSLNLFTALFLISIIAIIISVSIYFSYTFQLEKEKKFSENLSRNYNVYKLFANPNTQNNLYKDSDILGNIIIPKININYPFFYGINEELLKFSPCRFYGNLPGKTNILCIAGHNYGDDRFFSNISKLNFDDLIIIEDNEKNRTYYSVYKKYEIYENEISSLFNSPKNICELTLLTCNNINNKRIIIKAKTESPQ